MVDASSGLGDRAEPVALVGCGTIGAGWAATYLAQGCPILVHDPAEGSADRLATFLEDVWPTVRLSFRDAPTAIPHHLLTIASLGDLAAAALIHESGPESVPVKQAIYAELEPIIGPATPILSSSGGLMPSVLQANMAHPERLVVAHPFSPVYALPLVEVLGGQATSPETTSFVIEHLISVGKHPVELRKEVPGYLTNRLTFALLREAVHCLSEGVADARAIEDAVVYGITPRYLIGGAITSLTLAGGPGGMEAVMKSFAAAIDSWWSDLGNPSLDPEVQRTLIAAANELLDGRSLEQLRTDRDVACVETMRLLHGQIGAA